MNLATANPLRVAIVEDAVHLTLPELCRACRVGEDEVEVWVAEGVLEPLGNSRADWRFGGDSLRRARQASCLSHELKINPAGVALALDLLDEIALLKRRLTQGSFR